MSQIFKGAIAGLDAVSRAKQKNIRAHLGDVWPLEQRLDRLRAMFHCTFEELATLREEANQNNNNLPTEDIEQIVLEHDRLHLIVTQLETNSFGEAPNWRENAEEMGLVSDAITDCAVRLDLSPDDGMGGGALAAKSDLEGMADYFKGLDGQV